MNMPASPRTRSIVRIFVGMLIVLSLSHLIIPPMTKRILLFVIRVFPFFRIHDRSPYRRFLNEPKSKSIENDLDRDASPFALPGQAGLSMSA